MYKDQHISTESVNRGAIVSQQLAEHQEDEAPVKTVKTGTEEIDTRFGKVTISHDRPVSFPKGMLGMADMRSYCLTEFPVEKFARFRLLQSLDDYNLSFITLPLAVKNTIIDEHDVKETAKDLGIATEHLSLLLVVSVHRDVNQVRLSVNARAPVFVDSNARVAEQIVLRNNKYHVRHMLGGGESATS